MNVVFLKPVPISGVWTSPAGWLGYDWTNRQTNKQTSKQIITSFYIDSLETFSILIGFIIPSKYCLRIKYASILQGKKLFILLCLLIYFPGFWYEHFL